MKACPLRHEPVVEVHDFGNRWTFTGCNLVIIRTSPEAYPDPRTVPDRKESIEADRLIRESGCTPPR